MRKGKCTDDSPCRLDIRSFTHARKNGCTDMETQKNLKSLIENLSSQPRTYSAGFFFARNSAQIYRVSDDILKLALMFVESIVRLT